jgi:hypothetical protein
MSLTSLTGSDYIFCEVERLFYECKYHELPRYLGLKCLILCLFWVLAHHSLMHQEPVNPDIRLARCHVGLRHAKTGALMSSPPSVPKANHLEPFHISSTSSTCKQICRYRRRLFYIVSSYKYASEGSLLLTNHQLNGLLNKVQHKSDAVKLRLRDSQRQSRARRRDFIEDLQRRIRNYEQTGVQATLAMQQAARHVAQENVRLRTLLLQHGISPDEVNQEGYGDNRTRDLKGTLLDVHKEENSPSSIVYGRSNFETTQLTPSPQRCGDVDADPSMVMSCTAAAAIISSLKGEIDSSSALIALGCLEREDPDRVCVVKTAKILDLIDQST